MKKSKLNINNLIKWIFLTLSILCFLGAVLTILIIVDYFRFWLLIISYILLFGFYIFYSLARLKYKGIKLKYYFSNKQFEEKLKPSLEKFAGAPESFINDLKHDTKRIYTHSGNLFSRDINEMVYKDKNAKNKIQDLYQKLYDCIISTGGFVEFFKKIDTQDFESSWFIYNYMTTDLISHELEYLLSNVYDLTNFIIYDNGLSDEFTERNTKTIAQLDEIYSPLLFNFKEEIKEVLNKLQTID